MNGLILRLSPLFFALFLLSSCDGYSLKSPDKNEDQKAERAEQKYNQPSKQKNKHSNNNPSKKTNKNQPKNSDRKQTATLLDRGLWRIADPLAVGLDPERLDDAFDYAVKDGFYTQAVVIIKDGKLVKERYRGISSWETKRLSGFVNSGLLRSLFKRLYANRNQYSHATSWSVAKSFTGALIAIAIEQEHIGSFDDPVSNYIEEWNNVNDTRSHITIRDLLDMRSGLAHFCSDENCQNDNTIALAANQVSACVDRQLEIKFLSKTQAHYYYLKGIKPWVYSNCDTMILGEIIHRATGRDLKDYADRNLFSKIGMKAEWWRDKSDNRANYLAYCCLDATPRDFAKFGQLILNNGRWDSQQIIPESYIKEIKRISSKSEVKAGGYYGMQFWAFAPKNDLNTTVYYAHGYDGQNIMIDFDNKLVVVRNSLYGRLTDGKDDRVMSMTGLNLDSVNLDTLNAPLTLPMSFLQKTKTGVGVKSGRFDERLFFEKVIESLK